MILMMVLMVMVVVVVVVVVCEMLWADYDSIVIRFTMWMWAGRFIKLVGVGETWSMKKICLPFCPCTAWPCQADNVVSRIYRSRRWKEIYSTCHSNLILLYYY